MGFLIGEAPIRRTLKYLNAGRIVFKDKIKIFAINYNFNAENHRGAKEFVFWHFTQIQFKNPNVQLQVFKNMTPTPFITTYLENGSEMLIDVDNKSKDEIHDHVLKVLGKSEQVLKAEAIAREKKDNPANFGFKCEKHCICQIPGQITCPGLVRLPDSMRGKKVNPQGY
ncbi:probable 28S ribosomal protein S25, mitochondrial [Diaphorina citri]|uniref:Small ribosomal subunit protein mS25 n=1 Tax=Diaphorina citri TaxID=121845 RepID=A0A1S3DT93_DIACI|nr:probable 28S ribosomal protein S25, mitochondrial [Diaphorina citri]XP_008487209.1 probable 28S ribosomal protein S25, mitochondrial [Diaphorina citri]KAI5736624.1 hypothetical protein M8J76_005475 [Diaphorina citri]